VQNIQCKGRMAIGRTHERNGIGVREIGGQEIKNMKEIFPIEFQRTYSNN